MSISEDAFIEGKGRRKSQHADSIAEFNRVQQKAFAELQRVPLLKPTYFEIGMGYNHNMPCAVYPNKHAAVLDCNTGRFQPSWQAQREGWRLVKATNRLQRWLLKTFFKTERP